MNLKNESLSNLPLAWDTLLIELCGKYQSAVVIRTYESGNIKVRITSGHILIIPAESVVENYGYVPSDEDPLLKILIRGYNSKTETDKENQSQDKTYNDGTMV